MLACAEVYSLWTMFGIVCVNKMRDYVISQLASFSYYVSNFGTKIPVYSEIFNREFASFYLLCL